MRGAVLYGPRDVRIRGACRADDRRTDGCRHQDLGHLRVWVRLLSPAGGISRFAEPTPMGMGMRAALSKRSAARSPQSSRATVGGDGAVGRPAVLCATRWCRADHRAEPSPSPN